MSLDTGFSFFFISGEHFIIWTDSTFFIHFPIEGNFSFLMNFGMNGLGEIGQVESVLIGCSLDKD